MIAKHVASHVADARSWNWGLTTKLIIGERESEKSEGWFLDSGATSYVCYDRGLFSELHTLKTQNIICGPGNQSPVLGNLPLTFENTDGSQYGCLRSVLCVLEFTMNLVLVHQLMTNGINAHFHCFMQEVCH